MIVFRLYGQFHLSGMVYLNPAAVIPADVIEGFAAVSYTHLTLPTILRV